MIATDHAPHAPEEKLRDNIWTCDCGFPGVETQMAIMLTEVGRGRMTVSDYVRWSAVNPAKAWGIFPRKGVIQVGSDADIVVADLDFDGVIDQAMLHSRSRITPWHGRPITGSPRHTIVRGRAVVRDGELVGAAGWGRPVRQTMPPAHPRNTDKTMAAILRGA
jgi:dihydroorotase